MENLRKAMEANLAQLRWFIVTVNQRIHTREYWMVTTALYLELVNVLIMPLLRASLDTLKRSVMIWRSIRLLRNLLLILMIISTFIIRNVFKSATRALL